MKEKLRITSKLADTQFVAKTLLNGQWYVLTEDFMMLTASEFEVNPDFKTKAILKIPFTIGNKMWEMEYETEDKPLSTRPRIDHDNPESYDVLAQWERDREVNELNKRKRIAVREFFAKHMQLEQGTDFGNSHTPTSDPIAIVEIVTQKSKLMHLADRKKAQVFIKVDGLSWQELYDLALYYAPELAGKRRSEVYHGLIGLKGIGTKEAYLGGKMWQKTGNSRLTNAEDYLINYNNNPTVVMKIYINKAVALGVIIQGKDGLYMNGATYVGKTTDEAVVYFAKDIESYTNVIQPEVNKLSHLPEDDMEDVPTESYVKSSFATRSTAADVSATQLSHYNILNAEWEELTGRKQSYRPKYEELKKIVEDLRNEKVQIAKKESSPTTGLTNAIDPAATEDLDKLKELAKELNIPGYQSYKTAKPLRDKIRLVQAATA